METKLYVTKDHPKQLLFYEWMNLKTFSIIDIYRQSLENTKPNHIYLANFNDNVDIRIVK